MTRHSQCDCKCLVAVPGKGQQSITMLGTSAEVHSKSHGKQRSATYLHSAARFVLLLQPLSLWGLQVLFSESRTGLALKKLDKAHLLKQKSIWIQRCLAFWKPQQVSISLTQLEQDPNGSTLDLVEATVEVEEQQQAALMESQELQQERLNSALCEVLHEN